MDGYDSPKYSDEEDGGYGQEGIEGVTENRSFEERRGTWANTKGKSLARTPITQLNIYPSLAEVEDGVKQLKVYSEDGDDESVDEAGPSKPVTKTRRNRIKGLLPTCQSARIKDKFSGRAVAELLEKFTVTTHADNSVQLF